MSDKRRLIALGVAVLIFIAGNIIAGYYKWGASSETPDRQEQAKDTAEDIGDQEKKNNQPNIELDALKKAAMVVVDETVSGETDADPVTPDLQAKIASLKAENTYLLSTQRKDNDLVAQNLKLEEQLQAALKTKQKLEKENDQLRSVESDNREIVARQSELQEEIVSHKNEKSALENEITALREKLGDKQNLLNQNQQLSDQVLECSNASKNLKSRISKLQNRIDQYQNVAAENQQLQTKLEASTREIAALKAHLDKIRVAVAVDEKSDQ